MRYETADKFWEIEVVGKRVTTRFGKIGSPGQTRLKVHPSPRLATAAVGAAVTKKLAEGYAASSSKRATARRDAEMVAPVAAARNPALEKAIAADPEGTEPYLVYGDWLQGAGDPRGELISLQHARLRKPKDKALAKAEAAYLKTHREALFGPLADLRPRAIGCQVTVEIDWHCGFIRGAVISADDEVSPVDAPVLVAQLLELPVASMIRSLRFGQVYAVADMAHYPIVIEQLLAAKHRLASLRELRFGSFPDGDWEVNWGTLGKLAPLCAAFPALERLSLRGGDIKLGAPTLHQLRELVIESDSSTTAICPALDKATFPKLERLSLTMGPNSGDLRGLQTVLDGRFPRLQHLALEWCDLSRKQLELLSTGETLAKLKTLSLASGALTDTKAAVIVANAARYMHLESIDLDNNLISRPVRKQLAKLCEVVRFGDQQDPDDGYEW